MCQTTHLKILDLVIFSDLTLTLTWAKYETISLVSTFAWSLGVHMESFGRKMLRLRSLRSATWKHPILTFDLTLTWHVTSILNFRKWFGSVSSRSFECRLVRLSTSIRFRDSTGVGSDPPPGCSGYRNSPGGGGLRKFPTNWKRANVVPVFKKGDRKDPANYRPVLSNCSKIVERVACDQLIAHVSPVLSPAQHGFLAGRSCETNPPPPGLFLYPPQPGGSDPTPPCYLENWWT